MSARRYLVGLVVGCSMLAPPALAHGLLMKLRGEGELLIGELYYSNGTRAGGEWIEVIDQTTPGEPQTLQTEPDGRFQIEGEPGHRYQVTVSGDEGHEIVMEITLDEEARGQMIETEAVAGTANDQGIDIPAWALIGGVLLLSVIPVFWLRRRERNV